MRQAIAISQQDPASPSDRVCRRGCPQLPLVTFRGLVLQDLLLELSVPPRMEDLVPRDHDTRTPFPDSETQS